MKKVRGDLWDVGSSADAIVITTNGTLRNNRYAVMGKGCAREAAMRFPSLPKILGEKIFIRGNVLHTFLLPSESFSLVTFPVKHQWWQKADMKLIAESTLWLLDDADKYSWETIVLPRPGCGYGGLNWSAVEPVLDEILDDRFTVVSLP